MGEVKITEKSTKAQILEAYNQQKEEMKALRAMKDSPEGRLPACPFSR